MVTTTNYTRLAMGDHINRDYFDCAHPIRVSRLQKDKGGAYDDGELCPTNCNGATLPNQ
jgi:hypothetical protein